MDTGKDEEGLIRLENDAGQVGFGEVAPIEAFLERRLLKSLQFSEKSRRRVEWKYSQRPAMLLICVQMCTVVDEWKLRRLQNTN